MFFKNTLLLFCAGLLALSFTQAQVWQTTEIPTEQLGISSGQQPSWRTLGATEGVIYFDSRYELTQDLRVFVDDDGLEWTWIDYKEGASPIAERNGIFYQVVNGQMTSGAPGQPTTTIDASELGIQTRTLTYVEGFETFGDTVYEATEDWTAQILAFEMVKAMPDGLIAYAKVRIAFNKTVSPSGSKYENDSGVSYGFALIRSDNGVDWELPEGAWSIHYEINSPDDSFPYDSYPSDVEFFYDEPDPNGYATLFPLRRWSYSGSEVETINTQAEPTREYEGELYYRRSDYDTKWDSLGTVQTPNGISIDNSKIKFYAQDFFTVSSSTGVVRSTNYGVNWSLYAGLPDTVSSIQDVIPMNGGELMGWFIPGNKHELYHWTGDNWNEFGFEFSDTFKSEIGWSSYGPNLSIKGLAVTGDYVVAILEVGNSFVSSDNSFYIAWRPIEASSGGGGGGSTGLTDYYLLEGSVSTGAGWYYNAWLGFIHVSQRDWIYHNDYGWIYANAAGNSANGAWLYMSNEVAWFWSGNALAPGFAFDNSRGSFVFWDPGTRAWWPF